MNRVHSLFLEFDVKAILATPIPQHEVPDKVKTCTVLWGVLFWRNKKVWNDKLVTPAFAMVESFKSFDNWRKSKKTVLSKPITSNISGSIKQYSQWLPPVVGSYKINVDVVIFPGEDSFSIDMV